MEENILISSENGLPCESEPFFNEEEKKANNKEIRKVVLDWKDVILAVIYIGVSYQFVSAFTMGNFGPDLAIFTVAYVAVVLAYTFVRNQRPTRESYFWMVILLGIGGTYALWSVMEGLQVLMLIGVAAYWTLGITGNLQEQGKTSQWIITDMVNACFVVPFSNFTVHARVLKRSIQKTSLGKGLLAVGLGLCIALPLLAIVLPLLSGADAGFMNLVNQVIFYASEHFFEVMLRLVIALPITAYLFGLHYGGLYRCNTEKIPRYYLEKLIVRLHKVPNIAMNTAVITLCLVYLLFIGLQSTYLFSAFAGIRPEGFTYADYARRGFFELCMIASLNVGILMGANAFSKTKRSKNTALRWLNVILSALTLLLITAAMSKMFLYIGAYGLTEKRILTSVFMLWLIMIFIFTIIMQWKKIPIIRWTSFCGAVLFCLLCVIPVEYCISLYNGI